MLAFIYKGAGRNSFVVQMQICPGVFEVHCANIFARDRQAFDALVRSISPIQKKSLVPVSIVVGEYCLAKRAFVNCELHHPPLMEEIFEDADDWCPEVGQMPEERRPLPVKRMRERWTSKDSSIDSAAL